MRTCRRRVLERALAIAPLEQHRLSHGVVTSRPPQRHAHHPRKVCVMSRLASDRIRFLSLLLGCTPLVQGCRYWTEPDASHLVVTPADTSVVAGQTYHLRVQLLDDAGNEIPRSTYSATFELSSPMVAEVRDGDVVVTLTPGFSDIIVTVPTRSGDLRSRVQVGAGSLIHGTKLVERPRAF